MTNYETCMRSRVPSGTTDGGRFATEQRTEAQVRLDRQRAAARALLGDIPAARALGGGLPVVRAPRVASPLARLAVGASAVRELVERRGWAPAEPLADDDSRFPAGVAATNGTFVVQPYGESEPSSACLVALPTTGAQTWSRAVHFDEQGRVVVADDERRTAIRALDSEQHDDQLVEGDLAVLVERRLAS